MKTMFKTLVPIKILISLCSLTMACVPLVDRRSFLTNFPDSRKLNTLGLVGTHSSASYAIQFSARQTQGNNITQQLNGGIRVLDMRVARSENVFEMYHERYYYLGVMFGDIVNEVRDFLRSNPKELVIMFMQGDYNNDSTINECEVLENQYIEKYGDLFVQHWSVKDTIGQHRGKILLARGHRGFQDCTTDLLCEEQNRYESGSKFRYIDKWNAIAAFQDKMFEENSKSSCYINYLSAHRRSTYSFTIANQCRIDNQKLGGMNTVMANFYRNPKNTLYIVMVDHPIPLIVNTIFNSN